MKHIVLTILLLLSITGSSQVTDEEWLVDYLGYNLIEITTYEMEIGISPESFSAIPIASKYNKEKYQLKYGKYSTEDWKGTTELYLRREKSYLLRCMDFVISRGEYEVKDNILILKDEDLNCEYELLIGEDCLMSKRIPTEYGCLLKYENEK